MPSVTCLRLSDVSVICRVTYFQFPIQSAFLPYIGRQAALCSTAVLIRNIGHRTLPEIWVSYSLGERILIDSNGKMETRHPVEGQFCSEFPAICNHSGVMTA